MKLVLLYEGKNAAIHKEVGQKLWELDAHKYVLRVTKNNPIRSLGANNYFHMVLSIFASYTGHYIDEVKDEFKYDIGYYDILVDKLGKPFKRLKSTSKEDSAGMASLTNQLIQWGREKIPNCVIPRLEDTTYLHWFEVQNNYENTFRG